MIRALIHQQAAQRGDAPAILAPDHPVITYGDLNRMLAHAAVVLSSAGLQTGSTVALVCSNGPVAATSFLGIAAYTACAPLNPAYRAAEFEYYFSDLKAAALFIQSGIDSAATEAARKLGIPVLDTEAFSLREDGEELPPRTAPDEVALLLHTSGTTSRPKLVPLTQANLMASARNIAHSLSLGPEDRCLNVMPLFHVHGLEAALLASLASSGSVVCCPGFVGPSFFDWIQKFRPTWYTAVPTIHQSVLERARLQPGSVTADSLRFVRSCSSALAPSLMHDLQAALGVPVVEAYGMTEAAHQMTSNPLPPAVRKPGSVGVPAGPAVAIMDDRGRLLGEETQGEVVIRGTNVTAGYRANEEANAASFTDGWFRTGDLGYFDREGYLFLSGRRKEIINRGGEKIAPREVDEALLGHSAVAQAVAFAARHSVLGESVAAAVVLHPGCQVTEQGLRAFASERLALFKVPEKILFLPQIPKGPTGKVQRIGLADRLQVEEIRPAHKGNVEYVAPRTALEKRIARIFAAVLGISSCGMADHFPDLGGDSILAMLLLQRIRESENAEIPYLLFADDPTPAGICSVLQSRAPSTGEKNLRIGIRAQPGPVLICVPGSHGDISGFFQLARKLGDQQAVTALQLPDWPAGYSIRDLAQRYASEILEAHPHGPWHFVGVCTGGFIAWEVAQLIRARRGETGLLALLDCYNHVWASRLKAIERAGYRLDLLRRRAIYQSVQFRSSGWSGASGFLRDKFRAAWETTGHRLQERLYRASGAGAGSVDLRLAVRLAAARYVPELWPGDLELFRVDEPHVDAYDYPQMGWRDSVSGRITVHSVGGTHLTLFREPQLQLVASRLLDRMRSCIPVSQR